MRTIRFHAPLAAVFIATLLFTGGLSQARDVGIFVDGGFGRKTPKLNKLVDDRIDRAKEIYDARHQGETSHRVGTKADLEAKLRGLNCGAGAEVDNVTIVMMGHGNPGKFYFAEERTKAKREVKVEDFRTWLKAGIVNPEKCCVRVVLFSCHSGSMIQPLFKDCPSMKAVFASCRSNEKSFSDQVVAADGKRIDNGDWMDGFNHDLNAVPGGVNFAEALLTATDSAWGRSPLRFVHRQHPTGWIRGKVKVRGHVKEDVKAGARTATLVIYDPVFLRGRTVKVAIPGNVSVGNLAACTWVQFNAEFGNPGKNGVPDEANPIKMCENPKDSVNHPDDVKPPRINMIAHVVEKPARDPRTKKVGHVIVHVMKPNWYSCRLMVLKPNGNAVWTSVDACQWIRQPVDITNPSKALRGDATRIVRPQRVAFPITAHVESITVTGRGRKRGANLCFLLPKDHPLRDLVVWVKGKKTYPYREMRYVRLSLKRHRALALKQCDHVLIDLVQNITGGKYHRIDSIRKIIVPKEQRFSFNDAGVERIRNPGEEASLGEPMNPRALFRNAGRNAIAGSQATCEILDASNLPVYSETISVDPLAFQDDVELEFPEWIPPLAGDYTAVVRVSLAGDDNPYNDRLETPFSVVDSGPGGPPEGWQPILIGNEFVQPAFGVAEGKVDLEALGQGIPFDDETSFLFQEYGENFDLSCLVPVDLLQAGQSAGLMCRLGPDPQAPFAGLVFFPGQGLEWIVRDQPGAAANGQPVNIPPHNGPLWLGLEGSGGNVTPRFSLDGDLWQELPGHSFTGLPPDPVFFNGLVAASPSPQPIPFDELFGFADTGGFVPMPTDVIATALDPSTILVEWGDSSLTEFGFLVERAEGEGPFEEIAQLPPDSTQLLDSGLQPQTVYFYRVAPITLRPNPDRSEIATAETHGGGIEQWAASNGVAPADLFEDLLGDGTPTAYSYFTGSDPHQRNPLFEDEMRLEFLPFEEGGTEGEFAPRMLIPKAPGVHDLDLEIQILDEFNQWVELFTIRGEQPPGEYEFIGRFTGELTAIMRVQLTPVVPDIGL